MQLSQSDRRKYLSQSIDFNYKMLVSACSYMTLYLLKKYNEAQFLFEDPLQRKYKVKLGQQIECNCHQGNLGHCIHSLYILTRIYKLPQNHQFIFKKSFNEEDLLQLKQLSKSLQEKQFRKQKKPQNALQKQLNSQLIRQKMIKLSMEGQKAQNNQSESNEELVKDKLKQWPKFQADTVCPICYDQIQNQTPIIDCQCCHNYFHTKCLRVWVAQKNKEENNLPSCPMCRRNFQLQIQERITKMNKYYIDYHQSHGINCSNCGKDILVKLYKCLLCQNLYLCSQCYLKWEHKNHDKFIGKQGKKSEWVVTERSQFNINKLNANLQYFKKFGASKNCEFIQLMGPKYEKFLSSYIKKPTLKQHIINSLFDVQKQVHKTYKKLDFTQKDICCCTCKKKKIVGMRRMSCKHFIDQKCLKFLLESGIRQCPIDKSFILPGLKNVKLQIQ